MIPDQYRRSAIRQKLVWKEKSMGERNCFGTEYYEYDTLWYLFKLRPMLLHRIKKRSEAK